MRTAFPLLFSALLIATSAATTGYADTRSASMGVSVTVTRSCDVTVSAPEIGVTCRTRQPSTVQVRIGDGEASLRTLHRDSRSERVSTTVPLHHSDAGSRIVTVNF